MKRIFIPLLERVAIILKGQIEGAIAAGKEVKATLEKLINLEKL